MSSYPFHTAVVDGVEVAGVLFDSQNGKFYEFQDPDSHDEYEKFVDPRTGDVLAHGSKTEQLMADILRGQPRATVPADEWEQFRETYRTAESDDFGAWADQWRSMAEADPRFEGGATA